METKKNFLPLFKEKEKQYFTYNIDSCLWVECTENEIDSLWHYWLNSVKAERFVDEDGFAVYGLDIKERPKTICYKYSQSIDELKEKLTIGKEYLFSDMLQEEKSFTVEWKKGILTDIEKHPYSANIFVTEKNQVYLYCKEIE